jgi:hypothetical protein
MTGMPEGERKAGSRPNRELGARAERSLKDVDRLLRRTTDAAPHEKAMAQLEQARVLALLQLAQAIRTRSSAPGK